MAKTTFRVRANRLPEIQRRLPAACDRLVRQTALAIEAEAKELAPVDTGALRASITTEMVGPAAAVVGVGVDYAAYQEYGTTRTAPHPFLTPAGAHAQAGFRAAVADLEKSLR